MKANPEKLQIIAVVRQTYDENITFNLENNVIKCEESVKLLGITIDFKLNFDEHVSNICKKASRQLNVLKRIGKHLCKLGKLNVYYSFILSNFNYCPLTWNLLWGSKYKENWKKKNPRKGIEIYLVTLAYESLLIKSQLTPLKVRRLRSAALESFRILNNLTPVYLNDLLTFKKTFLFF